MAAFTVRANLDFIEGPRISPEFVGKSLELVYERVSTSAFAELKFVLGAGSLQESQLGSHAETVRRISVKLTPRLRRAALPYVRI